MKLNKITCVFSAALIISCFAHDASAGKGEIIINAVKKGIGKADDLAAAGKSVATQAAHEVPVPHNIPNKNIVSPVELEGASYWQSSIGIQVARRLAICTSTKLNSDPALSNQEAREYCKKAFLYCKSNKNNYGLTDDQCIAEVNKDKKTPSSPKINSKYEHLPKFDADSLKTQ